MEDGAATAEILVSVILPVFNGRAHLRQAAMSVLNQTHSNLELLIVDDGSTDGTAQVAQSLAADDRVRVINKQNGGVSSARNAGLDEAKGEFVAFIDADDTMEPELLETLIAAQQGSGADMVRAGFFMVERAGDLRPVVEPACVLKAGELLELGLVLALGESGFNAVWSALMKRSVIGHIRFDEKVSVAEDHLYLLAVLGASSSLQVLDRPLYNYWYNPQSIMNSPNLPAKRLQYFPAVYQALWQLIADEGLLVSEPRLKSYQARETERLAVALAGTRAVGKASRADFEKLALAFAATPEAADFYSGLGWGLRLRYLWFTLVMRGRVGPAWVLIGIRNPVLGTFYSVRNLAWRVSVRLRSLPSKLLAQR